jgi:uncharacterized membrane protein
MGYLIYYLYLIVFVKLLFLFFALSHLYFRAMLLKNPKNTKYQTELEKTNIYKGQTEFVFTNMMALLLIYIFNPKNQNEKNIDKETKILMYIFGFIIIITSDWNQFIDESTIWYLLKTQNKLTNK